MNKNILYCLFILFTAFSKSQINYFNETFAFKDCNFNACKIIADDKIYMLNADTNSYIISSLRLDGTVISSFKYGIGLTDLSNCKTMQLFHYNDKLLSVFSLLNDTSVVMLTDTFSGNIVYSKKYACYNIGSELLDNGDLVIFGSDKLFNVNVNSGNIVSAFSYPTNFNGRVFVNGIHKNRGSSYFLYGSILAPSTRPYFIIKIENNQTMSSSGLHFLPYAFNCSDIAIRNNMLFLSSTSNNGWQSNPFRSLLKSDTIFNGNVKTYQGVTATNTSISTAIWPQSLCITNNNVLLAANPNNLVNYSYNDFIHNVEVLSFDFNLNYLNSLQYPAYSYTMEPTPRIEYYKGNTYISSSNASTISNLSPTWTYDLQSFKYFWLTKADSVGASPCTVPSSYIASNFTITDSLVLVSTFTPTMVSSTNASISISNIVITPTVVCNTISGIAQLSNQLGLNIYPNPTNSFITISSINNIQKIEMHNITGQVLLSESVNAKSTQLSLQNLAEGVYFIKVRYANGLSTVKKLIKQ